MPFTFLSHQAPVLPLKIWRPRWFDGTALVIGSMAPDLAFITYGTQWSVAAHASPGFFLWCVPVTLLLVVLVKRVMAAPLAAHLPDLGSFHLRDFGRLGAWRLPSSVAAWLVLLSSAALGASSHLLLDAFTHGYGFVVHQVPMLAAEVPLPYIPVLGRTWHVYDVLQLGGSVVGFAVTVAALLVIGRRGLLRSWYPDPPPTATAASKRTMCCWLAIGILAAIVVGGASGLLGGHQALFMRAVIIMFMALAIGCRRATSQLAAPSAAPAKPELVPAKS